ncbi:MAG: RDD family protein [Methanobacterium sp.]
MQNLWGKRFAALVLDFLIIILVTWVLSALVYPLIAAANIFGILNYWLIVTALIVIVYFTYFEGRLGTTPGKNMMKIEVVVDNGKMNYKKAFIRNLSKILVILLIVDIIVDYAVGNSKLRYLDEIAGTDVKLKNIMK